MASEIGSRQRHRFNELWRDARSIPLSPDLIRFAQWAPLLEDPIVELGCGDGLFGRTFTRHRIVSVDQSMTGILRARSPRILASVDAVPIRTGFAQTVLLAEVLEHVADPMHVLQECRRITGAQGHLLISVPAMPLALSERLYHRHRIKEEPSTGNLALWDPEHERRFTQTGLEQLLQTTGWRIDRTLTMFGSATTAAIYWVEPFLRKVSHREIRLANRLAKIDQWFADWDHQSCIAYRCSAI